VSHQTFKLPRTPCSTRFYNLNAFIPSLRFKVRDKSLTHISPTHSMPKRFYNLNALSTTPFIMFEMNPSHASPPAHSTCDPIPHKFFLRIIKSTTLHVTAHDARLRRPPNARSTFVALVGHVLLRPPLPRSLQSPCNAIITTNMINHGLQSLETLRSATPHPPPQRRVLSSLLASSCVGHASIHSQECSALSFVLVGSIL